MRNVGTQVHSLDPAMLEHAQPDGREGPAPTEIWLHGIRRQAAVRLRAVLGFEALRRRMGSR